MPKPFYVGGAFSRDDYVYVERPQDRQLLKLLQQGNHCNLHAGRQSGKTSIIASAYQALRKEGHQCVIQDLTKPFEGNLSLIEGLFELAKCLQDSLPTMPPLRKGRKDTITKVLHRLLTALLQVVPDDRRLYLTLDELDFLMKYPEADVISFFLGLREFIQQEKQYQQKLVIILISVLTPTDMILNQNSGGISLTFFRDVLLPLFDDNEDVCQQLISQGFSDRPFEVMLPLMQQVLALTGGQPYLTSVLCQELRFSEQPAIRMPLLKKEVLSSSRSPVRSHITGFYKQLFDMKGHIFKALDLYKDILKQSVIQPRERAVAATLLENIGLVRVNEQGILETSNLIYKQNFHLAWVEQLLAEYETHRQNYKPEKSSEPVSRLFKSRIALIFCGGTVGMVTKEGQSNFKGAYEIIEKFVDESLNKIADIELVPLFELDGINVTPTHWHKIGNYINQRWHDFDGFVIGHGTDTLGFSASALSYMLGRVNKPVVFTGAQTSIDILQGDTRENLIRACYVAAHPEAITEVQVSFADKVFRGVRTEKKDDRLFQGFHSPGWPPLAQVTENYLINTRACLKPHQENPIYQPDLANELLFIPLIPGMKPIHYQRLLENSLVTESPFEGILITTPGGGNIPSVEPYNFRPFIQMAIKEGVPVLISSQMPVNPYTQEQYEMASVPAEYGAMPAGNLTVAAAYTKFSWVIGRLKQQAEFNKQSKETRIEMIKADMRTNYVGEEGEYGE